MNNEVLLWRNGYPIPGGCKEVFSELLICIDVQYSPTRIIKQNIADIIEIMSEYCELKKIELKGMKNPKERKRMTSMYTRFRTYLNKLIVVIEYRLHSVESIQRWYYEYLMTLAGLGPLRGYSTGTKLGGDLHIDPERQSMMSRPGSRCVR